MVGFFEVRCSCGQILRASRTRQAQAIRCKSCEKRQFVLPQSPFPSPDGERRHEQNKPFWLWPTVAAVVTVGIVAIGFALFFATLKRDSIVRTEIVTREQIEEKIAIGQKDLQEGSFLVSSIELGKARGWSRQHPDLISREDAHRLEQSYQEAVLLSQLLEISLEELVQKARELNDKEWQARFQMHYRGKSVLLDDVVIKVGKGQYRLLHYQLRPGPEQAELELSLRLLERLDLTEPRRLVLGARLEAIERGEGGHWVIRFAARSGVLMTHEAALRMNGIVMDAELLALMEDQAKWAMQLREQQPKLPE